MRNKVGCSQTNFHSLQTDRTLCFSGKMIIHSGLIFCILPFVNVLCQKWTQMPGYAVQISAKGNELWAVTSSRLCIRWNGYRWESVGMQVAYQVAATADGFAWMISVQFENNLNNLYRYTKVSVGTKWENPWKGKSAYRALHISALSRDKMIQLNEDEKIYTAENLIFKDFSPNDRNNWKVAMGEDNEIWKLDPSGFAYRFNTFKGWQKQIGITGKHIDVQNASRVVITDSEDFVWLWNGKVWTRYADKECAQATVNYNSIFCVDRKERIWKLDA